jgi:hypothetical protein
VDGSFWVKEESEQAFGLVAVEVVMAEEERGFGLIQEVSG